MCIIKKGIDVYTNRVIVELEDNSLNAQKRFKEYVIDSKVITYKMGEKNSVTATYKAGEKTTYRYTEKNGDLTNEKYIHCSIGFRAKRNGKVGYVTAGHCAKPDGGSFTIGTVGKAIYTETMDAALVIANSGVSISNDLKYYGTGFGDPKTLKFSSTSTYVVGGLIAKVGQTTQYRTGKITAVSFTATTTDGQKHTNMMKSDAYNDQGDSGGPILSLDKLTSGTLIGITSIGKNGGGDLTGFYRVQDALNQLGATAY